MFVCPRIGKILHWQPPDVHIFDDNPSLVLIQINL